MRKRRWLFWLVMVLATFALAIRGDEGEDDGAGGTPPAGEPEMEKVVEVPDENVLLQGELNPNIHEVQEDEILTAHYGADTYTSSLAEGSGSSAGASASGTQFPDYMTLKGGARGYQPGHILVCPRNERTPHEYAVVIESVSAQPDGSEYCGVRRVGIDDVVTDGNVFLSAGAHPKYTLSAARNAGKRSGNDIEDIWEFIKTGSNASAIMDYPAVFSYPIIDTEISTAGSSALKTEFQKYLGFEVESDFNILAKLDMMILASVEGGVTGKAALVFPGRFKAGGKFEVKTALKKEFDEIDLTKAMPIAKIWFNIGSVPVYMNINLNPVVKLEASVAAKLSSSVEYGISGMFGFYYEDSAVRGVPLNPQPEMEGSVTPENDTEGYAKLSIAPKITCGFYNMADGLSIKAGPAFKGAVKQSENAVTLEVEASVKASADLLNVFKHVATLPGIKTELILWEMDPPIELLRIPLPGGGTTPTLSPATSGNWIDIKSTSWYDKDPSAASFEIDSAEGLAGLAYIVNIRGTSHDNFYGKTITLTGNIDLGGREWTPIGTTSSINYYFQGTFDGGSGYTIANLTIKHEGSYGNDYYPAGLFGGNGGTIINVILSDVYVSNFSSSYAGGIAGWNNGTIEGCETSGTISSNSSYTSSYAGGIAGWNNDTIEDCETSCTVSSNSSYYYTSSYAGGIVGYNNDGTIGGCTTKKGMNISAAFGTGGRMYVGGFIGYFHRSGTLLPVNRNDTGIIAIGHDERVCGPSEDINS